MLRALACLVLLVASQAWAAPRLAVVVGNNLGLPGDPPLRFAERDARRVAETLREVGGIADLTLLAGADAAAIRRAFAQLRARAAPGAVLLVYYSGHAGLDGLHVAGQTIAWDELGAFARLGRDDLRIVLVDACHAGQLARRKGFVPVPPEEAGSRHQGSAVLAAAEWFEVAAESDALGGSFFTHALVSGLRGAADANRDGLVTLGEVHAHVSRETSARTATSGVLQHPTYRFDIAGQGEVVLARLADGAARVRLADSIEGNVVVLEHGSAYILVEAHKRKGEPLAWALPKGRYRILVRGGERVGVAEVTLPWGGEARIGPDHLTSRSYQEVAVKGGIVDLRRHDLRVGVSMATPPLAGMGVVPAVGVAAARKLARAELGVRAALGRKGFDAVDTRITTSFVELGVFAALAWPRRLWDLRAFAALDATRLWQDVAGSGDRQGWMPGLGVGAGVRVPLSGRMFVDGTLEGRVAMPDVAGQGRSARLGMRGELSFGWAL